jgi:hypothetical protein
MAPPRRCLTSIPVGFGGGRGLTPSAPEANDIFGTRVDQLTGLPVRIRGPIAAVPAVASGVLQGGKNRAAFRHSSQWGGVRAVSIVVPGNTRLCRKAVVPA